jgi:excisionase family DNA binding protein
MSDTSEIIQKLSQIVQLLSNQSISQKEIFSLEEASEYLGVSTSYLYKLTSTKKIPHYIPTGKKIYFKKEELTAWLFCKPQITVEDLNREANNYLNSKLRRFI